MNNDFLAYFETLKEESNHCQHENVIVIPEYRSMICQDCGCEVNSFDFIMNHCQDLGNIVTGEVRL